jgi:hypothetical protein
MFDLKMEGASTCEKMVNLYQTINQKTAIFVGFGFYFPTTAILSVALAWQHRVSRNDVHVMRIAASFCDRL